MGKAIEGAAMLGAAVGMGALAFFNPALVASPLFDKVWGSLILGGLSMEAGAIAGALTQNRGQNITTRQPAGFRQIIYGTQRVGGNLIYASTTGSHKDQYNRVIILAGHQCEAIENLYLDGRQVHWNVGTGGNTTRNGVNFGGSADGGTYSGPNGEQYNFGGLVYCEARYGDQFQGDVISGLTANDPTWSASGPNAPSVMGCTYVYLKIEDDANQFPSQPEIRFTVRGKNNIYDPRTGTRGYSTNWALCVADVLTDPQYGLGLDFSSFINAPQAIAAANVCDEQVALAGGGTESRYALHFHYDDSLDPGSVLDTMMTGAAGRLSFIGGEYYIWPAYWQGPSFFFTKANITTEEISWKPYRSLRDRFNRVNGTYIAPNYPYNTAGNYYDSNGFYDGTRDDTFSFAFQPTNYPQYAKDALHGYTTDAYLAEDLGIQLPKEIGQQTVLSIAQAQRVAKIYLERNRQQGSGSWGMGLECFDMQEMDVTYFNFAEMGWTDKILECNKVDFAISSAEGEAPTIRLQYSFNETAASVYEWSVNEELNPYDVALVPSGQSYTPAPPTALTLTSGVSTALQTADGVTHPRILVQWLPPLDTLTKLIQVQYQLSSAPSAWLETTPVDATSTSTYIADVVAGAIYNVRIRGRRASGAVSAWVEIDNYTVALTLSVVGINPLASGSLSALAFGDGTAEIIVAPFQAQVGTVSVPVLQAGPYPIIGLAQQQGYWVYYVDPTFVGGVVTPIATTNVNDFLNKPGYFLIGFIVTPYAASGGGVTRYLPTAFADTGSFNTSAPTQAYDGDLSTYASVNASYTVNSSGLGRAANGKCTWSGFPSIVLSAPATLYFNISLTASAGASASVSYFIGGVNGSLSTAISTTPQTYSATVPAGTNLASISIGGQTVASDSGSSNPALRGSSASLKFYEIFVQD